MLYKKIKFYLCLIFVININDASGKYKYNDSEDDFESNDTVNSFYDDKISKKSYLLLSSELDISNNLSQQSSDSKSGYTSKNSAYLSYQLKRKNNTYSINYNTFYTIYNKNNIQNELYWLGTASLYQNLYFKPLYLSIVHQRNRYLLDENGSTLPKNQGERDILTLNPKLIRQLTTKSNVQFGYANTRVDYSKNSIQNSNRNEISFVLENQVNRRTSVKLNTAYSDIKFTNYDADYEQLSMALTIYNKLAYGSYLLESGLTKVTQNSQETTNPTALFKYNYKKSRHDAGIILRKTLTDTSSGLELNSEENGDLNESTPAVTERGRVELFYKYKIIPQRLVNSVQIYFDRKESQFSLNNTTINNTDYQRGVINALTLYHSPIYSSSITVDYRRTDREKKSKRDRWLWRLSTSYQVEKQLFLTASIEHIKNKDVLITSNSYDETRFKTKITFKY